MAVVKQAVVTRRTVFSEQTTLLDLRMTGSEPLGFRGGQYIIIDTGLKLPDGRAAKRAYSLLTPDADQETFCLAAKRIGTGLGSNYLNDVAVGTTIPFSGPWGKLYPDEGSGGSAVVVAADTGITAALGLVQGAGFRRAHPQAKLLWLTTSWDEFLTAAYVRECLPQGLVALTQVLIPPPHAPARPDAVVTAMQDWLGTAVPGAAYLMGDGHVVQAAQDVLLQAGVSGDRIKPEYFFNRPTKPLSA